MITSGQTTPQTTSATKSFSELLRLIEAAVATGIDLVQIREKQLTAKALYELTEAAARIARGSVTRLLVNDRADIAVGGGAHGVHLATDSLAPDVIRSTFGDDFLIGASTHSLQQASTAQSLGADFVVLGPVFETSSKREYGAPLGVETLDQVSTQLWPFPVLALGGIKRGNVAKVARTKASGIAAISMLSNANQLDRIVAEIRHNLE